MIGPNLNIQRLLLRIRWVELQLFTFKMTRPSSVHDSWLKTNGTHFDPLRLIRAIFLALSRSNYTRVI